MSMFSTDDLQRKRDELAAELEKIHIKGFGKIGEAPITRPDLLSSEDKERFQAVSEAVSTPRQPL